MKRILALLIACSLVLSCAACAERGQPDPPEESLPPRTEPEATPQTPPQSPVEQETGVQGSELTQELPAPEEPDPVPEEPYVRVIDPAKPMVALTFDDGPHETYSDRILDILEEHHALATFFEVGRNVGFYPEPVRRMVEMGCEVASHSYRHADLTTLGHRGMLSDLEKTDQAFIRAIGYAPVLVRPPYGAVNRNVKTGSGRCMITWTVDPQDWRTRDADAVVEFLQNWGSLDGEVVLLHSIHESTVRAVEVLVPWLIEEGYQLVTVSELLAYYYGEVLVPNTYYSHTYFSSRSRTDTPVEVPEEYPPIQIPAVAPAPVQPTPPPAVETPAPEATPPAPETPPGESEPPAELPPEGQGGEGAAELPGDAPPADNPPEGSADTPPADPPADTPADGPPDLPEQDAAPPEETPGDTPDGSPETNAGDAGAQSPAGPDSGAPSDSADPVLPLPAVPDAPPVP